MTVNHVQFERWLRERGYAESSIRLSLTEARQIDRLFTAGEPLPASVKYTGLRMVAAGVATGALASQIASLRAYPPRQLGGRKHKPRRKHDARSMDDASWKGLFTLVRADTSDEARVIEVLMAHGKRIGDVLRVEREELRRAVKTGVLDAAQKGGGAAISKIDESWRRLWEAWQSDKDNQRAPNVAGWLCPTNPSPLPGSGAYKRVQRKLKAIVKIANIDERVFLHRLRRTVAVQALRTEKDLGAVQQLLGHASAQTTARYLDEARPEAVAEVQRRVRKRFTE